MTEIVASHVPTQATSEVQQFSHTDVSNTSDNNHHDHHNTVATDTQNQTSALPPSANIDLRTILAILTAFPFPPSPLTGFSQPVPSDFYRLATGPSPTSPNKKSRIVPPKLQNISTSSSIGIEISSPISVISSASFSPSSTDLSLTGDAFSSVPHRMPSSKSKPFLFNLAPSAHFSSSNLASPLSNTAPTVEEEVEEVSTVPTSSVIADFTPPPVNEKSPGPPHLGLNGAFRLRELSLFSSSPRSSVASEGLPIRIQKQDSRLQFGTGLPPVPTNQSQNMTALGNNSTATVSTVQTIASDGITDLRPSTDTASSSVPAPSSGISRKISNSFLSGRNHASKLHASTHALSSPQPSSRQKRPSAGHNPSPFDLGKRASISTSSAITASETIVGLDSIAQQQHQQQQPTSPNPVVSVPATSPTSATASSHDKDKSHGVGNLLRRPSTRSKSRDFSSMFKQSVSDVKTHLLSPLGQGGNGSHSVEGPLSPISPGRNGNETRSTSKLSNLKIDVIQSSALKNGVPLSPITPNLQAPKHFNYLESATNDKIDFSELIRRPSHITLSPIEKKALFTYLKSLTPNSLLSFQKSCRKYLSDEARCNDVDVESYHVECFPMAVDDESVPMTDGLSGESHIETKRREDHGDFNRVVSELTHYRGQKWVGSVTLSVASGTSNKGDSIHYDWELPFDGSEKCDVAIHPSTGKVKALGKKSRFTVEFTVHLKTSDPVDFIAILNLVDGYRHFFVIRAGYPQPALAPTLSNVGLSKLTISQPGSQPQTERNPANRISVSAPLTPVSAEGESSILSSFVTPPSFDCNNITSSCIFSDMSYNIPVYLSLLLNLLLSRKGFEAVGIFREKGIPWEQETLNTSLRNGIFPGSQSYDVYAVATCMKVYVREKVEASDKQGFGVKLMAFFEKFAERKTISEDGTVDEKIAWDLVTMTFSSTKPTGDLDFHLLQWLLDLFVKVTLFSQKNQMSLRAIITAWIPNLLAGMDPETSLRMVQPLVEVMSALVKGRMTQLRDKGIIAG